MRLLIVSVSLCLLAGQALAESDRQKALDVVGPAAQSRTDGGPLFQLYLDELRANPNASPSFLFPPNIIPNPAMGFNPNVNYTLPNYSSSPNIRKFVDKLPGLGVAGCTLGHVNGNTGCTGAGTPRACCTGANTGTCVPYSDGTCGQNNLGQYIPVAQPDMTSYPNSAYYEINSGNMAVQMNSDLPAVNANCTAAGVPQACCTGAGTGTCIGTGIRGYFQANATDPAIQNVKQYLGPAIVARVWDPTKPAGNTCVTPANPFGVNCNGWPVRIKEKNTLPLSNTNTTCANPATSSRICLPVDTTIMGAGMGPLGPAPYGTTTCDMGTAGANCDMFTENRVSIYHLHGGRTPWISDGTPHQWITPANDPIPGTAQTGNPWGMKKGQSTVNVPDMVGTAPTCIGGAKCYTPSANDGTTTQFFSNEQSSRLMFYHDHVYGITRLNVYKGLAAPYLLVDAVEDDLIDGTNTSGKNTWGAAVLPKQAWGGAAYRYGIPLVIQDKAFVNDPNINSTALLQARGYPLGEYDPSEPTWIPGANCIASNSYKTATNSTQCGTDPLWEKYVASTGGQLWMSHEYMPVENIYDPLGNTTNGRWDYGPFLIPPMIPTNLVLPSPTLTPEALGDTMIVNGTAFPYVEMPPDIVRFRILSVGNDRTTNLQLYKADPLTLRLKNRGTGYAIPPALPPAVTVAPPSCVPGPTCIQATASATVSNGVITDLTPATNCNGFTSSPTVTITGGTGTCSVPITAFVPQNSLRGSIGGFQGLQDAAGNYTCTGFSSATPPTVTISAGGGGTPYISCTATPTIIDSGQLLGLTVTNPGAGYSTTTGAPAVTIAAPGAGTTATASSFLATEVKMVDAAPNPAYPTWPTDGRDGGVPDPTTQGPPWILIGNEGGWLAQASIVPQNPIGYEYVRQSIPFAGVTTHSLLILPAQRVDVLVDLRAATPGDTYILYNDAPAPMPMFWPNNDYYTDDPDLRSIGGAATTPPGFGPNTRTVMQIRIIPMPAGFSQFQSGVSATAYQNAVKSAIPKAFAAGNDLPLVPQRVYNDALAAAGKPLATQDLYAQAPDSTLNITGVGQPIVKIKTIVPGNNCTIRPVVNIIGQQSPGSIAATATANLNPAGALSLLTGGTGYTRANCTIGAPNAATAATGNVQATCIAIVSGGMVNSVVIDEPGAGYSTLTAPTCTITGVGGGTGATCSAMVATANTVGSVTLNNGGSGYLTEPRVYLTPAPGNPNCMGATAVALLNGAAIMTGKNITEGFDPDYGRLDIRLGSTPNPLAPAVGNGMVVGIARYIDPPTEILNDGDTVLWRISHLGVDSHALHFHLYDVQVVNRIDWTNVIKPPYQDELGWRDTIRTNPMEDIVVAFRPHSVYLPFAVPNNNRLLDVTTPVNSTTNFLPVLPPPGVAAVAQITNVVTNFGWEYVWHCHMLEHEENDFMRPIVFSGTPPPAPAGLAAAVIFPTPSTAQVTLTWTGNYPSANGFTIQRSTSTTFAACPATNTNANSCWKIAGSPPPNLFVDGTPLQNTAYYYRVQSTNVWGASAWSPALAVYTVQTPQAFNCTVAAGATTDNVTCTWTAAVNPASFTLQRLDFNTGLVSYTIAGTLRTYTQSVAKGNPYWYRIRANITGGSSPYTAEFYVMAP